MYIPNHTPHYHRFYHCMLAATSNASPRQIIIRLHHHTYKKSTSEFWPLNLRKTKAHLDPDYPPFTSPGNMETRKRDTRTRDKRFHPLQWEVTRLHNDFDVNAETILSTDFKQPSQSRALGKTPNPIDPFVALGAG
ncbi:hypothetical protein PtA15_2A286 [Puccinia triticina]|uniref:Uncharacterized protein n=1 Tax=Puccinia triticina TaxID=208348 RepID=A0ABY7CC63_9BASI|nr:uncharacterized protein PtA15_2A286 [Puccinia triticina]WAQ81973.1 hypothetical protein PtA15_2A286 [Puccinia triticina]WAR52857.1 hypothetical protein PtB15_2B285 [Puccinia triticina]